MTNHNDVVWDGPEVTKDPDSIEVQQQKQLGKFIEDIDKLIALVGTRVQLSAIDSLPCIPMPKYKLPDEIKQKLIKAYKEQLYR